MAMAASTSSGAAAPPVSAVAAAATAAKIAAAITAMILAIQAKAQRPLFGRGFFALFDPLFDLVHGALVWSSIFFLLVTSPSRVCSFAPPGSCLCSTKRAAAKSQEKIDLHPVNQRRTWALLTPGVPQAWGL